MKLLVTATIAAIAGVCFAEQQPSMRLATTDAPIHLDGRLDEPAWTNATAVTLMQQSPHPGSATPYSTTMR
ncbi:MAG: hypothetical protein DMF58_14935, partial [Acidobacteria bacterium]